MKKFIIGKKVNMTQLFDDSGVVVPVTVIAISPCVITQVKTKEADGYTAAQVGYGVRKSKNISKPQRGHFKTMGNFAGSTEFRDAELGDKKVGDAITLDQFVVGDKVKVQGVTRGLGFQGVVKRHGFHGHPVSHGHKDQERHSGSIGAGGVQKVFKGIRMGGHMGSDLFTVKNLRVVKVDAEKNELYVRGAVPGTRNTVVKIFA